jgi:regulator of protease activity HflC (stomatin/prohibitin superfamily)
MITRSRKILLIISLVALLIAGCTAIQTLTPSAQPTTKPLPIEAKTILVGFSIMEIFSHLLWSFVFALACVAAIGFLNSYNRIRETFHRNTRGKPPTTIEASTDEHAEQDRNPIGIKYSLGILILGILVFAASSLPGAIVTVPPDKVGVLVHLGKEQKIELESGTHLIAPFLEQVALISTREFSYIATSHVEDASEDFTDYKVGARTCDGVAVKLPYTIKFRIIPEMADQVYANYGSISAIQERVVKAESRQIVRQVPTNFSSVAMYTSTAIAMDPALILDDYLRELILNVPCGEATLGFESLNEEIRQMLLQRFILAGLDLTFFGIRQPDLGSYGEQLDNIRIAAKRAEEVQIGVAEAEALKEQGLINAEREAQSAKISTVTAAEAEAEAIRKKAEAEAAARIITAEAEAQAVLLAARAETEANIMVAGSLTSELVEYRLLLALYASWNGQLPMYTGGGGAIPLLNLPELPQ